MKLIRINTEDADQINFILKMRLNQNNTRYSAWNYMNCTYESIRNELQVDFGQNYYWLMDVRHWRDPSRYIGLISLNNINFVNRNAELRFMIDSEWHNKGYGAESGREVIKYAFNTLGLTKVYLGCAAENIGMNKLACKLEMKPEGHYDNHLFINGKYQDINRYYITKEIWEYVNERNLQKES